MDPITRQQLIAAGRTRWYAGTLQVATRRCPVIVHVWARDEDDARDRIGRHRITRRLQDEGTVGIADVTEQHR